LKEHDSYKALTQLFNPNRAEWTDTNLFVPPTYLHKLESPRPSILIGGRGTGKTTSLQSLKFDEALSRLEREGLSFGDQEYVGIFVRINKNRVRAFQGDSHSEQKWGIIFAHYFNLLCCMELISLGIWLEGKNGQELPKREVSLIASDFNLSSVETLGELKGLVRLTLSELQVYINNPKSNKNITFSMAETPLRTIVECLDSADLLGGRIVFCCIDEYENLLDYQQAIINTYIKHSEPPLSYKIGVRKNGFRIQETINQNDPLNSQDDYLEIEIADEGFEYFAKEVAEIRLRKAVENGVVVPDNLTELLEELSINQEAQKLGADKVANTVLTELEPDLLLHDFFKEKTVSEIFFLKYWQELEGLTIRELAEDWVNNETKWGTRFGNYNFASLFWLSKGNKGRRIRKYYCGVRVLLQLSSGNIRYFLELINHAIDLEIQGKANGDTLLISAESQTLAARSVGLRRLEQIENRADRGVQLKRLVLAIGKVLWEYARNPIGSAPEITSFIVTGDDKKKKEVEGILKEGVGYLAFEVETRTKATSNTEVKESEYRLHRIFCGFFEISYRKKRRVSFDADALLSILSEKPSKAISVLLNGRKQIDPEEMPEQLASFNSFYRGDYQRELFDK